MATTGASASPTAWDGAAGFRPGDRLFLDTNILVFATIPVAPLHAVALAALASLRAGGVEFWASRQVLREYLAATSRPQSYGPPLPVAQAIRNVRRFEADLQIAEDGSPVTAELLRLLAAIPCGGKQVHDANIAATMLAHGVPTLLTHNAADFRRFEPRITVMPLVP